MSGIEKLAVIGGGAWGTALAQVAAAGGRETLLWAIEDDVVAAINKIHENPVYLKGIKLGQGDPRNQQFLRIEVGRCLAGGHPRAAYARGIVALALPEDAADPLLEGDRGQLGQDAPRCRPRRLRDLAGGGAVGPDLRP